jgi:hypothetical protein
MPRKCNHIALDRRRAGEPARCSLCGAVMPRAEPTVARAPIVGHSIATRAERDPAAK